MGSPLGCTFADFYMSTIENHLMEQDRISNPIFYIRYVDDILAIFNSKIHIRHFINRLQTNSILKFTTELPLDNTFHFLDVRLDTSSGKPVCSVYIKPTNNGCYTDFSSHTLLNYKTSIIKTLVNRALRICSNWKNVEAEIRRLHQIFANNGYPQHLVDNIIKRSMDNHFKTEDSPPDSTTPLNFYIQTDCTTSFKEDNKILRRIFNEHITGNNNYSPKIVIYYKPRKIGSTFSTRTRRTSHDRANVVYRFSCPKDGCTATYYGYTTNSLMTRCKQHRYSSSSIHTHFFIDHHETPPAASTFINSFEIIYNSSNPTDLKIVEAINIKKHNPYINVKYNESYSLLKLFP